MLSDISNQFIQLINQVKVNSIMIGFGLMLLFAVHIINLILGYRLSVFGIHPRKPIGLIGVVCAPFLHGGFDHLFFNAIALSILANLMLLSGWAVFCYASILIILISGIGIWLFGRPAIHIGASSVVLGYWGFLLYQLIFAPTGHNLAVFVLLMAVTLYYLGGSLVSSFLAKPGVSVEGHFIGFGAGVISAWMLYSPGFGALVANLLK